MWSISKKTSRSSINMYVFWICTSLMLNYPVIDNGKTECQYPFLCVMNCADNISLFPLWLKFLIFNDVFLSSTNSISKFEQNFRFRSLTISFAICISPSPILIILCFAFNSARMLMIFWISFSIETKKELEISLPR